MKIETLAEGAHAVHFEDGISRVYDPDVPLDILEGFRDPFPDPNNKPRKLRAKHLMLAGLGLFAGLAGLNLIDTSHASADSSFTPDRTSTPGYGVNPDGINPHLIELITPPPPIYDEPVFTFHPSDPIDTTPRILEDAMDGPNPPTITRQAFNAQPGDSEEDPSLYSYYIPGNAVRPAIQTVDQTHAEVVKIEPGVQAHILRFITGGHLRIIDDLLIPHPIFSNGIYDTATTTMSKALVGDIQVVGVAGQNGTLVFGIDGNEYFPLGVWSPDDFRAVQLSSYDTGGILAAAGPFGVCRFEDPPILPAQWVCNSMGIGPNGESISADGVSQVHSGVPTYNDILVTGQMRDSEGRVTPVARIADPGLRWKGGLITEICFPHNPAAIQSDIPSTPDWYPGYNDATMMDGSGAYLNGSPYANYCIQETEPEYLFPRWSFSRFKPGFWGVGVAATNSDLGVDYLGLVLEHAEPNQGPNALVEIHRCQSLASTCEAIALFDNQWPDGYHLIQGIDMRASEPIENRLYTAMGHGPDGFFLLDLNTQVPDPYDEGPIVTWVPGNPSKTYLPLVIK
jgi:hypothetical protein